MLLKNVHIAGMPGKQNIQVENGSIKTVTENRVSAEQTGDTPVINFENALAFPGLINSHDHLDFNCFPQLGNRIYNSYREWGKDIHDNNKAEIDAVLNIPQELRLQWGMYKNLLNGVTTVVNHGKKIQVKDELITVLQNNFSLHSVGFDKSWKWKLNNPFKKNLPFVIHTGEGKDEVSVKEIDVLIKWNLLHREIIAVHGVAMNVKQAEAFKALVWCPLSNFFLLDGTAAVDELNEATHILFGTDSTLTAGWNIWEHLRLARKQNSLSDEELLGAATTTAAEVWGIKDRGNIKEGMIADIVIAKANDNTMDSFFALNPEDILLVLYEGRIRLFDESLASKLNADKNFFSSYFINGNQKFIQGDLPGLAESIRKYYPGFVFPFLQ